MNTTTLPNPDGLCEAIIFSDVWGGHPCGKRGKPEPMLRDHLPYGATAIIQVENLERSDRTYEGRFFCGTHSPSKEAARWSAKELAKVDARKFLDALYEAEADELEAALTALWKLTSEDTAHHLTLVADYARKGLGR